MSTQYNSKPEGEQQENPSNLRTISHAVMIYLTVIGKLAVLFFFAVIFSVLSVRWLYDRAYLVPIFVLILIIAGLALERKMTILQSQKEEEEENFDDYSDF